MILRNTMPNTGQERSTSWSESSKDNGNHELQQSDKNGKTLTGALVYFIAFCSLQCLQAGCPSCCPTNSIKALKAIHTEGNISESVLDMLWQQANRKWYSYKAYLVAAIVMTLSVLEGHFSIASLSKHNILYLWHVARFLCICRASCIN